MRDGIRVKRIQMEGGPVACGNQATAVPGTACAGGTATGKGGKAKPGK